MAYPDPVIEDDVDAVWAAIRTAFQRMVDNVAIALRELTDVMGRIIPWPASSGPYETYPRSTPDRKRMLGRRTAQWVVMAAHHHKKPP